MAITPTAETYDELQTAYNRFNQLLFGAELPACLITLQREKHTYGFFCRDRFVNRAGAFTDEIAMNPAWFGVRSVEEVLSTLVHEMAHLWQAHLGKPGRARYHNQEWAQKMETLGLMPSDTGKEGGKRTGDHMSHYIIPGGAYAQACASMLTKDYTLSWMDRFPPFEPNKAGLEGSQGLAVPGVEVPKEPKNKSNRIKYQCPTCGTNVWGKPALRLRCAECVGDPILAEAE